MSEKMTDGELNERLAKALGHFEMRQVPDDHLGFSMVWKKVLVLNSGVSIWPWDFSPVVSSDDLRAYVLPEIIKRGLSSLRKFQMEIVTMTPCPIGLDLATWFLVQPPAVLAAAALKVLEADDE